MGFTHTLMPLTVRVSNCLVRVTDTHCRTVETVPTYIRAALDIAPDELFYAGQGCARCEGLGVHGRVAVYELMEVTAAIGQLIDAGAQADRIQAQACTDGMVPITRATLALAREGTIALKEAWRVRGD